MTNRVECTEITPDNENITMINKAMIATMVNNYCIECGKSNITSQCKSCHQVRYCSKECQTNDWPYHKRLCQAITHYNQNRQVDHDEKDVYFERIQIPHYPDYIAIYNYKRPEDLPTPYGPNTLFDQDSYI